MPRSTFGISALDSATPGLSRLAQAFAGGDQAYQGGFDQGLSTQSKIAQAMARIRADDAAAGAHNSIARQNDAETGVLAGRPAVLDEALAAQTNTTSPMVAAFHDYMRTGQQPMKPAMGPAEEDGTQATQFPVLDQGSLSAIAKAFARQAPMRTNLKDTTPESLAKATGDYRTQDLSDAIINGTANRNTVGGAQAAAAGKDLYKFEPTGGVGDLFSGKLDETGGLAQANIGLTGAKTKAEGSLSTQRLAEAGHFSAQAGKARAETGQITGNGGPGEGMSPAAIENAAARYNLDGTLPPMGMGKSGSEGRRAILNRAADLTLGADPTQLRVNQMDAGAAKGALAQITKSKTMAASFEQTANANAELALGLSNKLDRTGSPLLNAGIQYLRTGTGSPEAAQFAAANETFVNEYAKIMSGGMGNGPVSDAARAKAGKLLTTSMTQPQYEGNIRLLQTEMRNRMKGFEDQETALRSRLGGAHAAPPVGSSAPKTVNFSDLK